MIKNCHAAAVILAGTSTLPVMISAMQSFGYLILQEHMKTCMTEEIQSGNTEVVDEVLELMKKLK